jgi:hypothetical protein
MRALGEHADFMRSRDSYYEIVALTMISNERHDRAVLLPGSLDAPNDTPKLGIHVPGAHARPANQSGNCAGQSEYHTHTYTSEVRNG